MIEWLFHWTRRAIYKVGLRPKGGSVWYSPSLSWKAAGADYARGFAEGIRSQEDPDSAGHP